MGEGVGSNPTAAATFAMALICLIVMQSVALYDENNVMPSFTNSTNYKGVYMKKLLVKSMFFVLTAIGASWLATWLPDVPQYSHQA